MSLYPLVITPIINNNASSYDAFQLGTCKTSLFTPLHAMQTKKDVYGVLQY